MKAFGLLVLLAAGCAHDPAHDRPIEPWASPAVPDTEQPADAGNEPAEPGDAGK